MINVENIQSYGWESAIRGMRNPMNSWAKSDSSLDDNGKLRIGANDMKLMQSLIYAGSEHRKFLRQIFVSMNITAPLYWWKEMDQYKVGTTTNSCSTMHKIHSKEFSANDFSIEHLGYLSIPTITAVIQDLNNWRCAFNNYDDMSKEFKENNTKKDCWYNMIQLLPSSYNQTRTWSGSLETILSICTQRKNHKLDEWIVFGEECLANIPYLKDFYCALDGKNDG